MQDAGIAEADASFDVDGWDAAAKTAALINVLMGGTVTPRDIDRTGIGGVTGAAVRAAIGRSRRVKLVASAWREDGRVRGRVAPEELPATDLLATLDGQQNALVLQTDLLGEIAIVQRGSGLTQTAYALSAIWLPCGADSDELEAVSIDPQRVARAGPPGPPRRAVSRDHVCRPEDGWGCSATGPGPCTAGYEAV